MGRVFSGQLLRDMRERRGMRHEVLAAEVGVAVVTTRSYERDDRVPSVPVLGALADALTCSTDDFFARGGSAVEVAAVLVAEGR